jgi:predicted TIM-barrel fold metal-dependent hydrolase
MKDRPFSRGRRNFLAATTALAALPEARVHGDEPPGGGRTSRIDCQSHLFPPELLALMERRKEPPLVYRKGKDRFVVVGKWVRKVLPKHTDVAAKLADMDAAGIGLTMLSINDPGPELFGDDGPVAARLANDFVADVARRHPGRFAGLAVLPLQDVGAALAELDRCIKPLGMKGILLYSNLNGRFPDEPEYRPLFRRAEEAGLPVLLHPAYPTTYEAVKGYEMVGGLGLMFDTTIALTRLILAGTLDRFPRLKLVCPHVGGALPYLVGRIDHQTQVLKRGAEHIRKPPSEYLRQVYLDTVSPLPAAIRYAYDYVGPDRLLFASDHPWVDPNLIIKNVRSLKLPAADETKIFRDNARRLFQL